MESLPPDTPFVQTLLPYSVFSCGISSESCRQNARLEKGDHAFVREDESQPPASLFPRKRVGEGMLWIAEYFPWLLRPCAGCRAHLTRLYSRSMGAGSSCPIGTAENSMICRNAARTSVQPVKRSFSGKVLQALDRTSNQS